MTSLHSVLSEPLGGGSPAFPLPRHHGQGQTQGAPGRQTAQGLNSHHHPSHQAGLDKKPPLCASGSLPVKGSRECQTHGGSLGDSAGEGERRHTHRAWPREGAPEIADEGETMPPPSRVKCGQPLL